MPSAVMLALEASQRRGGVAVRDRDGRAHEEWLTASLRHDDDLLPAIDRLYVRLGLAPRDTAAVGVSVGPGGFTGLRISVATAKMLGETLGAELVAVPSALVVAESYEGEGPIIVALASRAGTCWATRLRRGDHGWTIDREGRLVDASTVDPRGSRALLGDRYLPAPIADACRAAGVPIIEPVFSPLACLAVADRLRQRGETIDPLRLEPLYPRPPAAVLKRQGAGDDR